MRLVPMYFRCVYCAIVQPHSSKALPLSPATFAISLSQASESMDRLTSRDGLNVNDLSDDLKVHRCEVKCIGRNGKYLLLFADRISRRNRVAFLHRQVQILIRGFPEDSTLHHLVRRLLAPVHNLSRIGIELIRRAVVVRADELDCRSLRHAHRFYKRVDALPVKIVTRHLERGFDL